MFTGIVKEIGTIKEKSQRRSSFCFEISTKKLRPSVSASIAVNGVCLTVIKKTKNGFRVDVVPETLRRTNLGSLSAGSKVNLEPSLKIGDSLDGHFVTGHVDACGTVLKNGDRLAVKFPGKLKKFITEKGSVALNGVSLTIAAVKGSSLTTVLIPFTKKHTNLGELKKGDKVNIEVDLIARYIKA